MDVIHGGDITGFRLRRGRDPLDFSASLNPLGMPDAVRRAARLAVDESIAYPDPLCRALSARLSERLGVSRDCIFFGNGAADVIHRLALALRPRRALLPVPTFSEYGRALASVGCEVRRHPLREETGFRLDADLLAALDGGVEVLFLCQPNNPTGQLIEPELARRLLDRCAETGTLLVMDECFCRFVDRSERYSLLPYLSGHPNLFILDSFTKLYAMAGLRLGYGLTGDHSLVRRLYAAGQPWPVSSIAQAAGLAALDEGKYVADSLALLRREKEKLAERLARLPIRLIGSAANYLFFYADAPGLAADLERDGILIRDCRNFDGLRPGYYRAAVRTGKENLLLAEAMEKAMGKSAWRK